MPATPFFFARSANSEPNRRPGCISFPTRSAKPGSNTPQTRFCLRIFDPVRVNSEVTSMGIPTRAPRACSSSLILSKLSCLETSKRTISSTNSSACTPLISTRAPPTMDIFISCLIVPSPRLTAQARKIVPSVRASSFTILGVFKSGAVPISTRGMPSRSSE